MTSAPPRRATPTRSRPRRWHRRGTGHRGGGRRGIATRSRGERTPAAARRREHSGVGAHRVAGGVVERTANAVICTVPPAGLVAGNADVVRSMAAEVAPAQVAVVDLVQAGDTVDGDGLAALLELIAAVRRAGGVVAIAARGNLARRLRFVGVERLAPVCDSASLALVAARPA